jgi:RNA polymerase sigma-70 factor (ECF subfamily)
VSSTPNRVFADYQIDFGGVASRHSAMLFRVALRKLRNVEDAEDAVQDALLSAYRHLDQFEGRSQLSSWLTRIVINAARMKLRSRPRQEAVSLDQSPEKGGAALANELADARPNPESVCAQTEMEEKVRRALRHISPKLRIAFQLRELAGFSPQEAAEALGITPNTLKSRVSRARAAIALYLHKVEAERLADGLKASVMNRTPMRTRVEISDPARIQNEALIRGPLGCLS